jgi:hypothetical protein
MDNDWFFTGRRCLSIVGAEAWPEEPGPEVPVPSELCPRQAIAPTPREETVTPQCHLGFLLKSQTKNHYFM